MNCCIKFCIVIILSFLFWCGIYDNIISIYPNKCEMTYMYEYPQYKEVNIDSNHSSNNYKLYVYGEGQYFKLLTKGNFRGIPVLFIPGNQGSYKQVRSLASVAYRKSQETYAFHFNYFTVDFNEEIGALFGPVLEQQTRFVGIAIKAIMELYKESPQKPQSVVLVGHSIGGLVARAVVRLAEVPSQWVSAIITLATPHARPLVIPDRFLLSFYETVNDYWVQERDSSLKKIALVSIGGGKNDIQVPTAFTSSPFADLDETLLSVPLCWLTTDHLAIVWCKQLVLAVTRALFDSVDKSTLQIVSNKLEIVDAFKYHVSEKTEKFQSYNVLEKRIHKKIKRKDSWLEVNHLQHTEKVKLSNARRKLLAIPLIVDPQRQHLSLVFKGSMSSSWIIVCKARVVNDLLTISGGENLDRYIRIIPGNRKEVNVDLSTFHEQQFTHIVVYVEPNEPQISVEIDFSDATSREVSLEVPVFLSSFSPLLVVESTPPNAVTLNVTLQKFTEFWQFFTLFLKPVGSCPSEEDHPLVSFKTSWLNRREFLPTINSPYEFNLKVDIPSPKAEEGFVEVHIVKSSSCVYSVSLQKNLRGIFERIALVYASQLPAFTVCHLLLVLSNQYKNIIHEKKSFFSYLFGLSPISVIPFVKLGALGISKMSNIETDRSYLENNRINIEAMPLIMFACAMPLTYLLVSLLKLFVAAISHGTYICLPKMGDKEQEESVSENTSSSRVFSFSSSGAVLLISLAFSTCGALSIFIAAGLYVLKVVKMYLSVLQYSQNSCSTDQKDSAKARITSQESSLELHFLLTLLVTSVAFLNLPTLITWAKNLGSQEPLVADPSFFASVIILCSLAILWQIETWNPKMKYYKHVGYIIHLSSIMVILFGTIYLFRVNEIVSCTLLIIALHQLFPPE